MERIIEVGQLAGFCYGVKRCVDNISKELEQNSLYCLGEIVHNPVVIKTLEEKGLKIINSIDEASDGSTVAIRAHGIEKEVYEDARLRNIKLIDYTCPNVARIHNVVSDVISSDTFIITVSHKTHPETIGTITYCGEHCAIIEKEEDIDLLNLNGYKKIYVVAQTTFNEELFISISNKIKEKFSDVEVIINNTICNATSNRQKEVREMASKHECMIIIGGANSSNTEKLYKISKSICDNTFIAEVSDDLDMEEIKKFKSIGVMAGASTPDISIEEVVNKLKEE